MFVCTGGGKAPVVKDILEVRSPTLSNACIARRPRADASDTVHPKAEPTFRAPRCACQTRKSGPVVPRRGCCWRTQGCIVDRNPPLQSAIKVCVKDTSLALRRNGSAVLRASAAGLLLCLCGGLFLEALVTLVHEIREVVTLHFLVLSVRKAEVACALLVGHSFPFQAADRWR